jgi:hypothetical protein
MIDAMMTVIIAYFAVAAFRIANKGKDKNALTPLQRHFLHKQQLKSKAKSIQP